ncbi:MAG TPA: response regulator transcription factor [Gaiellaceae bacterium]|nr:response regulator transcription factor [Gaiellaceae bacterium]
MTLASDVNLAAPLRVLVADRDDAARREIAAALERPGFAVVATCGDAASATAAAVRERADICLVDVELPGGALETIGALVSLPLAPKVVVLGGSDEESGFLSALEAGASGYLLRELESADLADGLMEIVAGSLVLAPAVAARLVDQLRSRDRRRAATPAGLTDREWEVLQLLADGLGTKEIALRLGVSATTVRRQISSAVERIAATGRRKGTRT